METCVGCKRPIRWWHRKDIYDRPWHRDCFASWEEGYRTAQTFATKENQIAGYLGPWELYAWRSCNQLDHLLE